MTTTTPWSDTPPSDVPGDYHVRHKASGQESIGHFDSVGWFDCRGNISAKPELYYQFGPRVLSAEDTVNLTAEVERLRAENADLAEIKRAWGMAAKDL